MLQRPGREQLLSTASRRHAPGSRERGASAVELAIVAPIFLALIFFTLQVGLFAYGRTVAVQAAREGVSQLRLAQDPSEYSAVRVTVEQSVARYATSVGRETLLDPEVTSAYDAAEGRVEVTVSGRVISLVPGLDLQATAGASGTVERFEDPDPVPGP